MAIVNGVALLIMAVFGLSYFFRTVKEYDQERYGSGALDETEEDE